MVRALFCVFFGFSQALPPSFPPSLPPLDGRSSLLHSRPAGKYQNAPRFNQKETITEEDLISLRERLQHCDEEWKEGKIEVEGGRVPGGQAVVSKLLYETHNLMTQVQNKIQG